MQSGTTNNHLQPFAIGSNFGHLLMQSLNKISVTLLEQTICLIQYKKPAIRQRQKPALNQILQSPRGANHNIHPWVLQSRHLILEIRAPNDQQVPN